MANVKISELPVATSLSNGDSFPVVQGGVTKQAARSVLFASPTFTGTTTAAILTATGDVTFDGGAFVFNDSGADKDARFEGDGDPNLLFLDASTDRVGIGTSSPGLRLEVSGAIRSSSSIFAGYASGFDQTYIGSNGATGNGCVMATVNYANSAYQPITYDASLYIWRPSGAERMRLDASGNLGLGVTPSAWGGVVAMQLPTGASLTGFSNTTNLVQNAYYDGNWKYISTAAAALSQVTQGAHQWFTAPSGTAGNAISFTQAMTLDTNGNLITNVNSAAPTLSDNSTMSFELTSNTSLKIVVRGTDGTTRSVSLTLA